MEPARFYGNAVARIAATKGARLVLDVIDLWPELFEMLAPPRLRAWARILLAPLYWQRNGLVRRADAVVGVTPDYVQAVTQSVGGSRPTHAAYWGWHSTDAGQKPVPAPVAASVARERPGVTIVVYAGMLGNNYDIAAMTNAAKALRHKKQIRWIVAGAGPLEPLVRKTAAELDPGQFIYLGLQDAGTVAWLMQRADVGLCCYRDGSTVSMPLKFYDYLAAGLPVINSLGRELGRLVAERGIGLQYVAGDSDSLASAVAALADEPALRARCSEQAKILAREYDPARQHHAYIDFLLAHRLISPTGS